MKVFCKKCIYCNDRLGVSYTCRKSEVQIRSFDSIGKYIREPYCEDVNIKNKCPYYKEGTLGMFRYMLEEFGIIKKRE